MILKTKTLIRSELKDCKCEYKLALRIREQILNSPISPGRKVGYLFDNTFKLFSIQNQINQIKAKL